MEISKSKIAKCPRCGQVVQMSLFGCYCKPCKNAYQKERSIALTPEERSKRSEYQKNYIKRRVGLDPEYGKKIRLWLEKYNQKKAETTRAIVTSHLATHPCVDCGVADIRVLEFHHRDPSSKLFAISKGRFHSKSQLLTEMEKCDVICANCHSIRHYNEKGIKPK